MVVRFTVALALLLSFFSQSYSQSFDEKLLEDFENPEGLIGFIDSLITSEMEAEKLPAVAFILIQNGNVVHQKGYGVEDLETQKPVSVDSTIFRIGSITKAVTALAIMQLADQNLIHLEDEVNNYLPTAEQVSSKYKEPIRLKHLITHSSGLDQKLRGRLFESPNVRPDLREFLHGELVQIAPPGSLGSYDTYGITLAGRIIEIVSGMSFDEYLEKNIFVPLDMKLSGIELGDKKNHHLASGYGLRDGEFVKQDYEYYSTTPASSMDASTSDMGKLISALLSVEATGRDEFLSKKSLGLIHNQPQFRNEPDIPGFSYGFWEKFVGDVRVLWHGGIMNGYTSTFYLIPEYNSGFYFVYTRDFETGPNPNLRNILPDQLIDRWIEKSEIQSQDVLAINTERFEGTYAQTIYCRMCYEGEGANRRIFSIESIGEGKIEFLGVEFLATDSLKFADESGRYKISFRANENNNITHVFGGWSSDATYEKLGGDLINIVRKSGFSDDEMVPFLAKTYRGARDWESSANAYRRITELRPNDGRAYHYLGMCLIQIDKFEEAIVALKKAFELGQWTRHTSRMIVEAYFLNGNRENAFNWIEETISISEDAGYSKSQTKHFLLMSRTIKELEHNESFQKRFIENH